MAEQISLDDLPAEDRAAWAEIQRLYADQKATNWPLPEDMIKFAQDLAKYPPSVALKRAKEYREKLEAANNKEDQAIGEADDFKQQIAKEHVYSFGRPSIIGSFLRSILASLNGTPLSGLNWMELTEKGLLVNTPFTSVIQRTVTHKDLQGKKFELGVNPPAYLDALLGQLKSFGFKVKTPWGQITMREPGSGNVLAEVVAFQPDAKLDEFKKGLQKLHQADNPFEKHKRLPKLSELFVFYVDEWEHFNQHLLAQTNNPSLA